MASISLTNGNEDVDFPDPLFTETAPIARRAFESRLDFTNELPPTPLHDDLMGNIPIYTIWLRKFSEDKDIAGQEWQKFRTDAIDQYDAFDRRLKEIENELNTREDSNDFLDINSMLDKKANIDAVCARIDECEEKFYQVTKIFGQFAQYLSRDAHRIKVESMTQNIRERYFNLLQQRNRKRDIFRWVIPRLQRYRSSGSEIKTWLDSAESRSEPLTSSMKKNTMQNEDAIEQMVEELTQKKDVYEDFVAGGSGILSIHHELNNVFNVHLGELEQDVNDVTRRWDTLCLLLENYLNEIAKQKKEASLSKKTETEKIDIKIQDETHHCTCATPFKITKVGDGKYTFGTSKTIRLLRIHGQSIVVRVGGGWEYVYNFLMKVDPCRAKSFASGTVHNGVDSIHCSTGLTLTPIDNNDSSFTMSVQRMRKSSLTPSRKPRGVLRSTLSVDELDSCAEVLDSLDLSQPSPMSSAPRETRSKSNLSKNSTSTPNNKFGTKKLSHTDSKLYKSTENINRQKSDGRRMSLMDGKPTENITRQKSDGRRLSLMDRQSLYAQKRSASLVQATSVLDI